MTSFPDHHGSFDLLCRLGEAVPQAPEESGLCRLLGKALLARLGGDVCGVPFLAHQACELGLGA